MKIVGWGMSEAQSIRGDHLAIIDSDGHRKALCGIGEVYLITPAACLDKCKKCIECIDDPIVYVALRLGGYLD